MRRDAHTAHVTYLLVCLHEQLEQAWQLLLLLLQVLCVRAVKRSRTHSDITHPTTHTVAQAAGVSTSFTRAACTHKRTVTAAFP
jgi:hypothetical protein